MRPTLKLPDYAGWLALLGALLLWSTISGCALFERIEPHYVASVRLTTEAIYPRAESYLLADAIITPEQREARLGQLGELMALVQRAETYPERVTSKDFLAAERALYDAIGPWYVAYVMRDPDLSRDDRQNFIDTVESWDYRLKRAERAAGIRAPPSTE